MHPFIRAAEVWLPDADGTLLEHGGGLYGEATDFARRSRDLCFGRGEGLPGFAWEDGAPWDGAGAASVRTTVLSATFSSFARRPGTGQHPAP